MLAIIWIGIALHGPIYTFMTVAGRMFLDKRVPSTMRGQAQALYQLLVGSVAGVIGAFACDWLYHLQVTDEPQSWALYWWILASAAALVLLYFCVGLFGRSESADG